jgi:2-polyprenyl-6-methoxyphenol hydroxylase-like FAD-dependent oxidoreductase
MSEQFDVVVVGARCAGSPLATLLARAGVRVAVVEQATFPRDTVSTHVFQGPAMAMFDRLGVMDKIRATGAPVIDRMEGRMDGCIYEGPLPLRPGDIGGTASVRRVLLDPILADAAQEAGADVRFGSRVTSLVRDGERVTGVRAGRDGEQVLQAPVIVGADGRSSTVAGLVGARKYNVTPSDRCAFWAFFEGANLPSPDPCLTFQRWEERGVLALPCDSGLYQVVVIPDLAELAGFRADMQGSFMRYARSCPPVAAALDGATRVGKIQGIAHWEGYFRQASGPGWVLAGDAGYFKDPTPGQGISDALRQADQLSTTLVGALGGAGDIDDSLREWGRWRDQDSAEHYWFATDLGKGGTMPKVVPEMLSQLLAHDRFDLFLDLFTHRRRPSKVLSPPRLLGATSRLLARRGTDRRTVLREVGGLLAEDTRRRRLNRRPAFAAAAAATGDTDVGLHA